MINIKNIKLRGNRLLVTFNKEKYDHSKNGVIVAVKGSLSQYQTIVEVGPDVNIGCDDDSHKLHIGDTVMVDFTNYFQLSDARGYDNPAQKALSAHSKEKHPVFVGDIVEIDGIKYAMITDEDIIAIVDGDEIVPEESAIIKPVTGIITKLS